MSSPLVKGKLRSLPDFSDATAVLAVLIVPSRAVVGRSIRLRAGRWRLHRPAHVATRNEASHGGDAVVQHCALRLEALALDLVALASLIVYPGCPTSGAVSLDPSIVRRPRLPGNACFRAARLGLVVASLRPLHVDHQHASQLGRVLRR
jgi:hypothetical protein